jgi:hypothetical protein
MHDAYLCLTPVHPSFKATYIIITQSPSSPRTGYFRWANLSPSMHSLPVAIAAARFAESIYPLVD